MKDLKNNVDVVASLNPAARVNGTATGTSVDRQGFRSMMAVFYPGAVTDGVHTPTVEDSDDNATFAVVTAAKLQGVPAVLATGVVQRIGYLGQKRYIRPVIVTTGATTGAVSSAMVVRGNPVTRPLA